MSGDACKNTFKGLTDKYLIYGLIFLLIAVTVATILLGSVPPVSRDALTHHLFVPKLYLQNGGIYEIPEIPFSYYPMNLDLLYMIPLYFGNDIIPKYIHFLFALLTAWLIFNYLKTRTNKSYATLGALFFLSIPIIVKLSITVYVDLGLMFFSTASLLLLFRWLNSRYKSRYLLLAGICCGLAAGTKYNGLINIFLLTLFIPVLYIRSQNGGTGSDKRGITCSLLFLMATLVAFSPWLVRNYSWTSNPIYPLHNSLFQKNSPKLINHEEPEQTNSIEEVKQLASRESAIFTARKILYHEKWWQVFLLPVRFFFEGQDDNPRYFDGRLNPFLLMLPFFAFLRRSPTCSLQLEKYTLLNFSIFFFFFTFFQEAMRIRYIVCIVPPMVLLAIFGLQNIYDYLSKIQSFWSRRSIISLGVLTVTAMICYNAYYIVEQFQIIQPLSYMRGIITREQYITRFRPEYEIIRYANDHLKRDETVLCLFLGNRGYYMNFKPIFDRPFKDGILSNILASPFPHNSIQKELLGRGISYVLLRDDLTQNGYRQLSESDKLVVSSFFQNDTEKLLSAGGYSFFRIIQNPL